MQRHMNWLASAVVPTFLLVAVTICGAEETEIAVADVPAPVMEAANARFKGGKFTAAAKEMGDDGLVYEVTIEHGGEHIDATFTPDGEMRMMEKVIAVEDLPKALVKALEDNYPKATYTIVEQIFTVENKQEKLDSYEVLLVTADGKKLEVMLTAEGKVLKEEDA